jgi:hypothetical protein
MLDQRTLTSMKTIRTINQALSFMALDQLNFLRPSIQNAAHVSTIKNDLSNGLDSGVAPDDGNQMAKGLLAT